MNMLRSQHSEYKDYNEKKNQGKNFVEEIRKEEN